MSNQNNQNRGGGQMAAPSKQKTLRIGDTEYTFQRVPLSYWLTMMDGSKDAHGNLMDSKFIPEVLKHIVVAPKVSIDDFESMDALREVIKEAATFQSGAR